MPTGYLGEVRLFAFDVNPRAWLKCHGQLLSIQNNLALFSLLGTTYGGNGSTTFGIPDLRGRVPMHRSDTHPTGEVGGSASVTLTREELPGHPHPAKASSADADSPVATRAVLGRVSNTYTAPGKLIALTPGTIGTTGGSEPHENRQPFLALSYCMCFAGAFPGGGEDDGVAGIPPDIDPFCGEIRMFAGAVAPAGWAICDGTLLPISEYDQLFNLIGPTFGGDGMTTFGLPDLRGRVPVDTGTGADGVTYVLGERGGLDAVGLTTGTMAAHDHDCFASVDDASSPNPAGQVLGSSRAVSLYNAGGPSGAVMADGAVDPVGQGQAHDNSMPSLPITFIIAVTGAPIPPPEEDPT